MSISQATSQPINCYHCSEPVLAGATHCSKCGKERKDLYDVRMKIRGIKAATMCLFGMLMIAILMKGIPEGSWAACTSRLMAMCLESDLSGPAIVSSPTFWILVVAIILLGAAAWHSRQRYVALAGKAMVGW
jgi:ABC-type dipeptide/oligopeptide/nickel transport system permease component